jgi:DNA primase (bacterial type)
MRKQFVTKEQIEYIKQFLPQYLADVHNIEIKDRGNFNCPIHHDKTPSARYFDDYKFYCYSCGKTFDIFDVFAFDNRLNIKDDFLKIYNSLKKIYCESISLNEMKAQVKLITTPIKKEEPITDYTKYFKECHANIDKIDYIQNRGISKQLLCKYYIGYDIKQKLIIMPLNDYQYIQRNLEPTKEKRQYRPVPKSNIFNKHLLLNSLEDTSIFVCESIIDALSLEQIGIDENIDIKAIALNSTSGKNRFIDCLLSAFYKGNIILALDNDNNGRETSNAIKEELYMFNQTSKKLGGESAKGFTVKELHFTDVEKEDINDVFRNNKAYLIEQIKKVLGINECEEKEIC